MSCRCVIDVCFDVMLEELRGQMGWAAEWILCSSECLGIETWTPWGWVIL